MRAGALEAMALQPAESALGPAQSLGGVLGGDGRAHAIHAGCGGLRGVIVNYNGALGTVADAGKGLVDHIAEGGARRRARQQRAG